MNLPRTGAAEWAGPQSSPWDVVNPALRLLDAGSCRYLIEDRDLTAPPGSCADGACYLVAASPTGAWSGKAGKLAVAFGANASNGWQFVTVAAEGVQLYVRDEDQAVQYDGAAWVVVSVSNSYRIGFFFTTAPSASEVLLLHVVSTAFTFPANFATPNSNGAVGTNPAGSFALDVQRQVGGSGAFVSIGTITISTGGAFTFATASGTSKSIAVGDVIKVLGPATPDAAIANVAITLVGAY